MSQPCLSPLSAAFDTVQFKQHVIKIARNVLAFLIRQRSLGELQRCYNSHRDFGQQFQAPTKVSETKEAAPHFPHYCNVHPVLRLKWIEVGYLTTCKTCLKKKGSILDRRDPMREKDGLKSQLAR